MDGHAAFERERGGRKHDVIEVDRRSVLHLPAPALLFEIDGRQLLAVGPDGAVGEACGKLRVKLWLRRGRSLWKNQVFSVRYGWLALLVFVGDDTAGVAAGGVCGSHLQIHEEVALAWIADFDHLVVFDGVLVAVGADAPDVHGENLAVLVERDGYDAFFPALGAQDLDDAAIVLDCAAIWGDSVGGVFEQDDGVGLVGG